MLLTSSCLTAFPSPFLLSSLFHLFHMTNSQEHKIMSSRMTVSSFISSFFILLVGLLASAVAQAVTFNVPATDDDGNFTISWSGARTYAELYVLNNGQPVGSAIYGGGGSGTFTYNVTGKPEGTYQYGLKECQANGSPNGTVYQCDLFSKTIIISFPPPLPPANFSASISGANINLLWSAASGATSYEIQRNNAALTSLVGTNYTDTTATSGTAYTYKVRACKSSTNCSTWVSSNSVIIPIASSSSSSSSSLSSTSLINMPSAGTTLIQSLKLQQPINPANDLMLEPAYYGNLSGIHSVAADGAFNYSLPVTIPAGINNVQPQLQLNYNSNLKNGLLGWGWALNGLSTISRCGANIIRDGYVSGIQPLDNYKYCLDGQRLVEVSAGEYRTESETFVRIQKTGNSWIVINSNGTQSRYGYNSYSTQEDVAGNTFVWNIDSRTDIAGNSWLVIYTKNSEQGTLYPQRIDYTQTSILPAVHSIHFNYESRFDYLQSYAAGRSLKTDRRLASIEMKTRGQRVMIYYISYMQKNAHHYGKLNDDPVNTSRINQIRLCYLTDSECAEPLDFEWEFNGLGNYRFISNDSAHIAKWRTWVQQQWIESSESFKRLPTDTTIDIDKDGYPDPYFYQVPSHHLKKVPIEYIGSREKPNLGVTGAGAVIRDEMTAYWTDLKINTIDVNGDGYPDIVANSPETIGVEVYLNILENGVRKISAVKSAHYSIDRDTVSFIATQNLRNISPFNALNRTIRGRFGYKVDMVDMNGDGLLDAVRHSTAMANDSDQGGLVPSQIYKVNCTSPANYCTWSDGGVSDVSVALNTGTGFSSFFTWHDFLSVLPSSPGEWHQKAIMSFNDLNGDGLVDFIGGWATPGSNGIGKASLAYINNGKGGNGGLLSKQKWSHAIGSENETRIEHELMGDFNGDGLSDALKIDMGYFEYGQVLVPKNSVKIALGRGMPDDAKFTSVLTEPVEVSFNRSSRCGAEVTSLQLGWRCKFKIVDFNRDGRADLIEIWKNGSHSYQPDKQVWPKSAPEFYEARVYLAQVTAQGVSFSNPIIFNTLADFNSQSGDPSLGGVLLLPNFSDANQDGMPEPNYFQVNAVKYPHIKTVYRGNIKTLVTLQPIPADKTHTRLTEAQDADPDLNHMQRFTLKPTLPKYVVNTLTIDNGAGSQNTSRYTFKGHMLHTAGYGDLGFSTIESLDTIAGETPKKTITHYYQKTDSRYKLAGKIKQQLIYTSNSAGGLLQKLSDARYQWKVRLYNDDIDAGFKSPHYFVYTYNSSIQNWDFDGTKISDSVTQNDFYNQTPTCTVLSTNPSIIITQARSSTDLDYHADGVLLYTQTTTCDTSSSSASVQITATENFDITNKGDVRGLVQKSKQYAWIGNAVSAAAKTFYDARTQAFSYNLLGQLENKIVEPELVSPNSLKLTTNYLYNTYGSIRKITESWDDVANDGLNVNSRITDITETYDSNGVRKVNTTKSLAIVETTEYHSVWGLPTKQIDPNGLVTTTIYDDQGRAISMNYADGTVTTLDYRRCNGCFSYNSLAYWYLQTKTTGTTAQRIYYDGLSREIGARKKGLNGQEIYGLQTYNARGHVQQITLPFYFGEPQKSTVTSYDSLGRISNILHPDNSTEIRTYTGLRHTITNRIGQTQTRYLNGAGWVMRSVDTNNTPVDFTYWPFGDLKTTQVNNNLSTLVSITYDKLGRKIEITDPNAGKTTYTYNALNLFSTQVDAKNQRTCFGYDALGRQIKRVDNAASNCTGATQNWAYDTKPYGKGKPASLTGLNTDGTSYTEQYTYTQYGLPEAITSNFDGTNYTVTQHYDAFGRKLGAVYPTGYATANIYNNYGYISQIRDATNANLWTATDMDASGNFEEFKLGNNVTTRQTYEANTSRIETIRATRDSLVIQDHRYQFDALGNLKSRQDYKNNVIQNFCYDNLNRLTAARFNGCSVSINDFSYDPLGNLTGKDGIAGSLVYGTSGSNIAGPHAVTSANGWIYQYDAIGNLKTATKSGAQTRSVSYSPFNTPTSITQGSKFSTIVYGPNQARIKHSDSNGRVTKYVGGVYEEVTYAGVTQKIHYVGNFASLILKGSNTNGTYTHEYYHRDHQDSLVAISKGVFVSVNDLQLLSNGAWGERRYQQWNGPADNLIIPRSTAKGYTDHEHLDAVGLIHMNGRVYDPELGRFMSVDPFVQAPYNTQSYNRYSYVFNNPLSFVDPTGYRGTVSEKNKTMGEAPPQAPPQAPQPSQQPTEEVLVRKTLEDLRQDKIDRFNAMIKEINNQNYVNQQMKADLMAQIIVNQAIQNGGTTVWNGHIIEVKGNNEQVDLGNTTDLLGLGLAGADISNAAGMCDAGACFKHWLGKNGKWNMENWQGNRYTGARSTAVSNARSFMLVGKGITVLDVGVEAVEFGVARQNGDDFGMIDSGVDFAAMMPAIFAGAYGFIFSTSYGITDDTFGPYLASGIADTFIAYDKSLEQGHKVCTYGIACF